MKRSLIILPILAVVVSCSLIKPEKPREGYTEFKKVLPVSVLNIPLEVKVSDLEKMLNSKLQGLLYEDNNLDDNGGDNLMVKAWKKEDFRISVQDNILAYRLPLKLWIKAGWKVNKFGLSISDYREVNAEIALKFKTSIVLNPDWTITTSTTSDGYEWLSAPVVKIGPIDFPIKYLADVILKSNQKTITKEIDRAIADNLNLKKEMENLWINIQKPVKVNEEYNVWLSVLPQEIYSTPITGKAGMIRHTVGIKSVTEAFVGKEPVVTPVKTVPKLTISGKIEDDFKINLAADLSYDKVNELAQQYLGGKTFTHNKYKLLINNIDIYGSDNKFIIHLNVSGSLKGDLYFTGTPVYNDSTSSIEVKDLDYELKTKNALVKTGSWLFRSALTNMIQKNMVFPVKDQLGMARALLEENIKEYSLSNDFFVTGTLQDLTLGDIILTPESIRVMVQLKGNIRVKMK
ncbi:MAG: DUF4403 family protein [Bacteroidales bacterium]